MAVCVALVMCVAALLAAPSASAASPNDDFADAVLLRGFPVESFIPDVRGDTSEPGEPNHAGAATGRSRWWRWVAPVNAHVAVDDCSSGFPAVLAVYTGATLGTLREVGSSRASPSCDEGGRVAFRARAGRVYSIAVDGTPDLGFDLLHVTPSVVVRIVPSASAKLSVRRRGGKTLARLVYRTPRSVSGNVVVKLERDARGGRFFTAEPLTFHGRVRDRVEPQLSPGRGCLNRFALLACVVPARARVLGPLLYLGNRNDLVARVRFRSATTRVFARRGNDTVVAGGLVSGGPGNDKLTAPSRFPGRLSGGRGDDQITGSRRRDVIDPGPGIDGVRGRGGDDRIDTRDGFIDFPECGGRGSALIDALDDYPRTCARVRRRGTARAIPERAILSSRGFPSVDTFKVDVICPLDGPRVCRGTVAVHGKQTVLRKRFALPRRGVRGTVRFPLDTLEQWRALNQRVRVIVRSRDRSGRRRAASGIFKPEVDIT